MNQPANSTLIIKELSISISKIKKDQGQTTKMNPHQRSSLCSRINLSSLDILGSPFRLNFSSKNGKFQTKFGGYITLVISFATIIAFILVASQLFSNNSPVVNISPEFNPDFVNLNLYEEDLITPVVFKKGNKLVKDTTELSRYVTIQMKVRKSVFDVKTSKYIFSSPATYQFAPCSQEAQTHPRFRQLMDRLFTFRRELKKYLFCPVLEDKADLLANQKIQGSPNTQFTKILIFPCTLPDPTSCATPEELSDLEVLLYTNHKILEASNFENPVKYTAKKITLKIDPSMGKKLKYYTGFSYITDDSALRKKGELKLKFAEIEFTGDDYKSRNAAQTTCSVHQLAFGCGYYVEANYFLRTEFKKIRRSYKKASVILGEFGGYLKLLTSLVFFFYSFYGSSQMRGYLVRKMFFRAEESLEDQKINKLAKENKLGRWGDLPLDFQVGDPLVLAEVLERGIRVENLLKRLSFINILGRELISSQKHSKDVSNSLLKFKLKEKSLKRNILKSTPPGFRESKKLRMMKNFQKKFTSRYQDSEYLRAYRSTTKQISPKNNIIQDLVNSFISKNLEDCFEEESFSITSQF